MLAAAVGLGMSSGWAQTQIATLDLKPYGVMTKAELNVQHPIPDPPPERKGYTVAGPPGGIAWNGVGTLAVDRAGRVFVGLPIWASGYAPKNPTRGNGDKFRVLVVDAASDGKVERTTDYPAKSLDRLALQLADDETLLILADDKLMRVDASGQPTLQLAVPNEQKEFELWGVQPSTTGRTLRIWLNDKRAMFVNSKNLGVVKNCRSSAEDNDVGAMTDDLELSSQVIVKLSLPVYRLEQQAFCGKREQLVKFGQISFAPDLVNDEQFLAIEKDTIALRKLNGETVWTRTAPQKLMFDGYEGTDELSRDGKRVALRLMRNAEYRPPETTQTKAMPVEDSVGVWDVPSGQLIGVVPMLGHTENRFYDPNAQFALSSDGKLLAVLEDGVLTVWKLS
jgi:hypothetical protein